MKMFPLKYGSSRLTVFFIAVLFVIGHAEGNGFAENTAAGVPGGLTAGSLYNGTGNALGLLGSVTGIVTDSNSLPLSEVEVRIGGAMDITTIDGEYFITNLVKGESITITATGDGYEPYAGIVDVEKKTESIINIMMIPISTEPASVTTEPAPVATESNTATTEPAPVTTELEPITTEPDPVTTEPDPVTTEPDPVTTEPAPVATEPAPVATEPIGSVLDITPPESVTGLITNIVSSSQIDLSWNPSTDDTSVTGYRVYRGGVEIGTSPSTVYSDTGLSPATAYCYTVIAYDSGGNESIASTQACTATSPLQTTSPVTLAWDAPVTNEDGTPLTDLAGYRLYYGTSTGQYSESIDVGDVTQYTVENLLLGSYYYFAVTAYDMQGNESDYSHEISTYLSY